MSNFRTVLARCPKGAAPVTEPKVFLIPPSLAKAYEKHFGPLPDHIAVQPKFLIQKPAPMPNEKYWLKFRHGGKLK